MREEIRSEPLPTPPSRRMTREEGWGADANPADRPAYPKEAPSDVHSVRGRAVDRMTPTVKIFKSIEHPDLTPVFGTTCPPRGVSGALRDVAYRYGEGRLAHWMTLMLADRIDVIEGLIEDMTKGHAPNLVKERGWDAAVEHSRRGENLSRNLLIVGAAIGVAALGVALATRRSSS